LTEGCRIKSAGNVGYLKKRRKSLNFMDFNCAGKILDYNPYTQLITIKCDFANPENLLALEECVKEKKELKLLFKFSSKKGKQYFQQKFYYWFLKQLLIKYGADITSENVQSIDEDIRRNVFPCSEIEIDNRIIKQPKRMNQLSFEEMQKVIETLKDRYAHLGIDYSEIEK